MDSFLHSSFFSSSCFFLLLPLLHQSVDQGILDRVILHHSLGVEQLSSKSYTEALSSLKSAFQLAHSAGLTEQLQAVSYDFGIAAMHIIRAVPSPAHVVTSPMVREAVKTTSKLRPKQTQPDLQ